jgi:hypothetical protein
MEKGNPAYMYLKGHSSLAEPNNDSSRGWLDDLEQEKPGFTPANEHLAECRIQAHIYYREEMDAFTE